MGKPMKLQNTYPTKTKQYLTELGFPCIAMSPAPLRRVSDRVVGGVLVRARVITNTLSMYV